MAKHRGNKRPTNIHTGKTIPSYTEQLEPRVLLSTDLFVTDSKARTLWEYNGTGNTVNSALVSGLTGAASIAVSGSDLLVTYSNTVSFKLPSTVSPGTYYLIAMNNPVDSLAATNQNESTVVDSTQLSVGS